MKYYYINLENAKKRRENIEKQFKENNASFHRVEAFLYNDINHGNEKIAKENACCRSHIKAIYEFVMNSCDDYGIICEDDLTFELKKYWKLTPEEVEKNAPKDYGIIQLAVIFCNITNPRLKWSEQPEYFKWGTIPSVGSCLAYIINRKCAIELLNYYLNHNHFSNQAIFGAADSGGGIYGKTNKHTKFTAYTYKYPMFTYPNDNDTQLGNCQNNQQASKRQVINYLKQCKNYK